MPPGFVGREEEAALLDELVFVQKQPLIVICGPGGIGKTAMANYFVRRRCGAEHVRWISLYDVRDPSRTLRESLQNLDLPMDGEIPEVIVVDGAEAVSEAYLGETLSKAANRARNLPVVVTTRSRGSIEGARYLELGGLSDKETGFLIAQRAGFGLSPEEVSRLSAAVGNHPLAAQLAAGLLRSISVDQLLTELDGVLYRLSPVPGASEDDLIHVVRPEVLDATELLVQRVRQNPEDLYMISPRQFEELIAAVLRDMGWDAELTKATRDGGRDVLAYMQTRLGRILCLVEAKRYQKDRPVGVEIVRSLYGTFCDSGANSALLVTTSTFTAGVYEFQRRHQFQLGLRDYAHVVEWINSYGSRATPEC